MLEVVMKRKVIWLVVILVLVLAIPASAKVKAPVGERVFLWPGSPTTFPAGDPFHIKHGWLLVIPDEAPVGAWGFRLEVDGVPMDYDFVTRDVAGKKPTLVEKYFVQNFPGGLSGTHTFTGYWYSTCHVLVKTGYIPGPCADKNAVVDIQVHSLTIDFVP
jgi:hypothetical protein